jgi:hypothetical protein
MHRLRKGYHTLICRSLLLTGYLVFFAFQFNSQFFVIANNFVYGRTVQAGASETLGLQPNGKIDAAATRSLTQQNLAQKRGVHGTLLVPSTRNPSHLGADKRFHVSQAIRVPEIRGPGQPFYNNVRPLATRYCLQYSSSNFPVNAFRGPPSVQCPLQCC